MSLDLIRENERVTQISPLSPIDYVLEALGLPRIDPILMALSPKHVISDLVGFPTLNDLAEAALERMQRQLPRPRLPGLR